MVLEDKVAIVTGGSRGIGKAIALELAGHGANIVIAAGNLEEINKTVQEIQAMGRKAIGVKTNVVKVEDVENLTKQTLDEFGKIDILVNNAGITRDTLLMRMKEEDWDAVLSVNLKGAFNCTKAVARPMMKQRSGKIINISSVVGLMGNAGQCNYSASKAGLIGLTKSSARELASRNITVNAIAPGFIQTEMTEVLSEEVKEQYMKSIPLQKLGTPADIANAVLFLASSMADYITGTVLNVNGGLYM